MNRNNNGGSIDSINDNDIFTGREVKRMLAEVTLDSSPYVKISAACEITGIPRGTLKSRAPKFMELQQAGETPMIRVRRTSASNGAHWLFHEGDCWARRRLSGIDTKQRGAQYVPAGTGDEKTIALYAARVTAHRL